VQGVLQQMKVCHVDRYRRLLSSLTRTSHHVQRSALNAHAFVGQLHECIHPNTVSVCVVVCRARRARRQRDIVLVRLEQISPFPHDLLLNVVQQYHQAELVWCQEEPKNMGPWGYVQPRLLTALRHAVPVDAAAAPDHHHSSSSSGTSQEAPSDNQPHRGVKYIGRAAAASTATASFSIHQKELADVINAALTVGA
jgi:2-oxoglutarate dehydrogenase E1 component